MKNINELLKRDGLSVASYKERGKWLAPCSRWVWGWFNDGTEFSGVTVKGDLVALVRTCGNDCTGYAVNCKDKIKIAGVNMFKSCTGNINFREV